MARKATKRAPRRPAPQAAQPAKGQETKATTAAGVRILNCIPSRDTGNDWGPDSALAAGILEAAPIPQSKDLREKWWAINDQASTGSCVGWATADSVLRWHFVKAGRLRALAVTSAKRAEQLPDVPTLMESGVPDFEVTVWQGYAMPKGTSKAHVASVHAAMMKVLASPDLKQRFFDNGVAAAPTTPDEFVKFIGTENAKWKKAVALAGAKVE